VTNHTKPPIQAVLFDAFGTHVDASTGDNYSPFAHLIGSFDLPGEDRVRIGRMLMTSSLPTIDDAANRLEDMFPGKRIDAVSRRAAVEELEKGLARTVQFVGVDHLLPVLRQAGVKLALVSNLASPYRRAIEQCGIDRLVDVLVYSFDVGYRKPEPEIYEIALSRLDVAAEHAAMIGDDEVADGEGPRSVGLRAQVIKEGSLDGGKSLAAAIQWVLASRENGL